MSLKIDIVSEIPDFNPTGKWPELYEAAEKMALGQIIRVTLENRREVRSAQSSLQGTHGSNTHRKNTLRQKGYRFMTRTRPVTGKDGEWYLFIKRIA